MRAHEYYCMKLRSIICKIERKLFHLCLIDISCRAEWLRQAEARLATTQDPPTHYRLFLLAIQVRIITMARKYLKLTHIRSQRKVECPIIFAWPWLLANPVYRRLMFHQVGIIFITCFQHLINFDCRQASSQNSG